MKVEYTAYAPLMHGLAKEGILCVVPKMPCNLTVLDINFADGIQEKFPEVKNLYIGGYFFGGAMAACYVAGHINDYKGLILLVGYVTKRYQPVGAAGSYCLRKQERCS